MIGYWESWSSDSLQTVSNMKFNNLYVAFVGSARFASIALNLCGDI